MTDEHVLELSKRITGEEELMDLGIKVLRLPEFVIKTALYNKKEIQPASHDVLSNWLKQQNNRREACTDLHTGLRKCGMNQLASLLKQWVEGTAAEIARTIQDGKLTGITRDYHVYHFQSSHQKGPVKSLKNTVN